MCQVQVGKDVFSRAIIMMKQKKRNNEMAANVHFVTILSCKEDQPNPKNNFTSIRFPFVSYFVLFYDICAS